MSEVISKIPDKLELPEEEELGDKLVEVEVESPELGLIQITDSQITDSTDY